MKTETKLLPFFLPLPPWLLLALPLVAGEIANDPWLMFALAIFLLWPTILLFLGFGLAGIGCSLWCRWKTGYRRYWLSVLMGFATVCYGIETLLWTFNP